MIRRLKKDVLDQLPAKRRQKIEVAVDQKSLKVILQKMRGTQTPVNGEHPHPNFLTAHRLTGEAKVSGCIEFLETLLEAGCKFLLFAHHIPVMDAFSQFLARKKTGFIRIDGSTPSDERHNLFAKFQH